jgi:hypothetical protein
MGPELVQNLDGSEQAKECLTIILETIAGTRTIEDARNDLGVCESRFHQVRMLALGAALNRLEPRPPGRPPKIESPEQERIAELEEALLEKEAELKSAEVRLEIAQVMPQLLQEEPVKKTSTPKQRRRLAAKRRRRRRK